MRFKKVKEEEIRIGIAPLIDIVFLLLIFFMVTSHFDIASGVRIQLPKVTQKILSRDYDDKVTVIIDPSGKIYLEGKQITEKALQGTIKERVEKRGLFAMILQADKDVTHGKVVQVMDLAKSAGVQSIIIAAGWKQEASF